MKKDYKITSLPIVRKVNDKINKYRIDKTFAEFDKKQVIIPEPLNLKHEEYMVLNAKIDGYISEFFNIFLAKLGHVSKANINRNLKTLKVKGTNNISSIVLKLLFHFDASYNQKTNTIMVSQDMFLALFHELLHMCSTYDAEDRIYVGFAQENKKTGQKIGVGLTEGYTSFLFHKYFNNSSRVRDAYDIERNSAMLLNDLIGSEKMEEMYFSCDLYGLFNELKAYDTDENILKFLKNLDIINKLLVPRKKSPDQRLIGLIEENNELIKSWLYKKYNTLLQEGKIDEMTYFNTCSKINGFLNSILEKYNNKLRTVLIK